MAPVSRAIFLSRVCSCSLSASETNSCLLSLACSCARLLSIVSTKERVRMPRGPRISLSSTLRTSGVLGPTSFIKRIISSERYASWPQPKLTIWTYSMWGLCAAMTADESIRAWKLLTISIRLLSKFTSVMPGTESAVMTGIPRSVKKLGSSWFTNVSL